MEEETRARADARGRRTLEREFRRSLKPRVPPVESIKAGGHALEVDRSRAAYRRLSSNPLTASSRAVGFHPPFVNDDKPPTFSWRRPPSAPLGDVTRGRAAAGGTRRASPGASARFGDVVPPLRARRGGGGVGGVVRAPPRPLQPRGGIFVRDGARRGDGSLVPPRDLGRVRGHHRPRGRRRRARDAPRARRRRLREALALALARVRRPTAFFGRGAERC